jgi:conjugal transfer ATP-binding protein TraC
MFGKKPKANDIVALQRAREQSEVEQAFQKGITTLRDLIAPSSLEIHA